MLYRVLLTRAERKVSRGDRESPLGEFLQLAREEVHAISIAPPPGGGDQELRDPGIRRSSHAQPPLMNAGDSKFRRVVIGAGIDLPRVADRIIHAVRQGYDED